MAAAADRVLCSKACHVQNADKSTTEGMLYVFQSLARFVPTGGNAQQRLEIPVADIKGQKRSKNNPLLMLEAVKGKHVFGFASQDDRDAVTTAIVKAQEAQQAAEAAAAAAGTAKGGAGGAGGSITAGAAAGGASAAASAAAAAAAAGNQSGSQLAHKLSDQQRQELLASTPALNLQYRSLVLDSKALTEDEFWSSAAVQKVAGIAGIPTTTARSSKRGMANKLVDLARQHDAADSRLARVNMTAEDERQLLAEKPALKQLYDAQVGAIMSREEFWQRYFRYYMSKRIKRGGAMRRFKELQQNLMADSAAAVADMTGGAAAGQADADLELSALFAAVDGASLDAAARNSMMRRLNPAVDLAAAAEDRLTADGYGLAHNAARSEADQVQGYSGLSSQLAQDYNIHAAAVIGRVPEAPTSAAAAAAPNLGGSSSKAAAAAAAGGGQAGGGGGVVLSEMSEGDRRRFRQQAGGSGLDDLSAPQQQQYEELHVTNPRLYFSHMHQQQQQQQQYMQQHSQPPMSLSTGAAAVKQEAGGAAAAQQQQQQPQDVVRLLHSIDPTALTEQPMDTQVANKVLHELCGGEEADAARRGGPSSLPDEQKIFMQRQTMLVDELLRHFWAQIPVNTPEKEAKINRIQNSLNQIGDQLKKLEVDCPPGQKALLVRLIKPLWAQMDMSTKAYTAVQQALKSKQQRPRKPPAAAAT